MNQASNSASIRLGVFDDPASDLHAGPPSHPERPARRLAAAEAVRAAVLRSGAQIIDVSAVSATDDELLGAHSPGYLDQLVRLAGTSGFLDHDTYYGPESIGIAKRAAGGAVALTRSLFDGHTDLGVGLLRPPGHHASSSQGMGFCIVNHAAVAARKARSLGAERVAVIDWDVHHGNGTQEIFWDDPAVLYLSVHRFPYYPWTGAATESGAGAGLGYNVNVPLSGGALPSVYREVFGRIFHPILSAYQPDFVIVSAGFDAHLRDPLGGMALDSESFAWMTCSVLGALSPLARSRVLLLLEGGYDLVALTESLDASLSAAITALRSGRRYHEPLEAPPLQPLHEENLVCAMRAARQFWRLS
jgi:acetoin utilization deacetylase AcuC-like enzyme